MSKPFKIGDAVIKPGTRDTVMIPLSRLADHTDMMLKAMVIHGKKPGPTMFISAAIHGDEIIGVEIIRRLAGMKTLSRIKGTLILIPVVNNYGFLGMSRYLPDRRDLNRVFPGVESGSPASQLAYTFMKEIVSKCEFGLDLHSGAIHRENLPQIRANLANPVVKDMAVAFGASIMLNSNLRDGSLREAAKTVGCNMLLYESGEALRFDETAVRIGVKGALGVMRYIGMLPKLKPSSRRVTPVQPVSSHWVRAPISGLMRAAHGLGDVVEKGAVIASISGPLGEVEANVLARYSGVIIGRTNLPIVNRGDALFHVARVDDLEDAETTIETRVQNAEVDPLFDGIEIV
ncbi:succinylglutamate desuccinylase/aspartoacylase family protein [Robiginitomaculum antarcticum]|uniref:succinylglutamate desuccinylase/aspartoacylase family protein n=1 Tax=Robiginitomaculum antarcticum TaxID=437507 RepID=UPI000368C264|nr:succinylglutamate desuccinylase/aspartoacylase family protein [Robiginitomaculum antarcticum]